MKNLGRLGLCMILLFGTLHSAAQAEERVLIVGDSIMQAVSRALQRELTRAGDYRATAYTSIGTGLARMDLFDWNAKIRALVSESKPTIVMIMMGANDNQPMRTASGILQMHTPEWDAEYERRVSEAIDIMTNGGVKTVYWMELPDMRDATLQTDVQHINKRIATACATRPAASFQPVRSLLSRTPGTYSPYILQPNGMPLDIRAGDGIHLNRQGADLLAAELVKRLRNKP